MSDSSGSSISSNPNLPKKKKKTFRAPLIPESPPNLPSSITIVEGSHVQPWDDPEYDPQDAETTDDNGGPEPASRDAPDATVDVESI